MGEPLPGLAGWFQWSMGEGLIEGADLEICCGDISLEDGRGWVDSVIASGSTSKGSS